MTFSPSAPVVRLPAGVLLLPFQYGNTLMTATGAAGVGAGTANQGYYQTFTAPYTTTLVSIGFYCAAGTNNHDLALYDMAANRLVTRGPTATTAAAVNTWTLTNAWPVQGGVSYIVGYATAGTKTIARYVGSSVRNPSFGGRAIQAGLTAATLPNPAVFAAPAADAHWPILKLVFST